MLQTGIIERDLFKIHWVRMGAVFCKRYEGTFISSKLQDKAATGLWYTLVSGQPHAVEGEGATPSAAIRDAMSRIRDRIGGLNQALQALQNATS